MAPPTHSSDELSLYSDDSDDREQRPNRWTGPPSTWQQLNSVELDTLAAFDNMRNQDLALHLYNAFALKHRHLAPQHDTTPVPDRDVDVFTGRPIQKEGWNPPKSWVAWPLRADKVPQPAFSQATGASNNEFTSRAPVEASFSTPLEDSISATILRLAKSRFNARPWADHGLSRAGDNNHDDDMSSTSTASTAALKTAKYESSAGEENLMDLDTSDGGQSHSEGRPKKQLFKPTVTADDHLSNALLRPSVRHILTKLDTTLSVLHNTRESSNYRSDSADSDGSSSADETHGSHRLAGESLPSAERMRGSEPGSHDPSEHGSMAAPSANPDRKRKAGRPRKNYARLREENDREYAIRVAKLQKKPMPTFVHEPMEPTFDTATDADAETDEQDADAHDFAIPERPRPRPRPRPNTPRTSLARRPPEVNADNYIDSEIQINPRLGLRGWKDVLGAASLAGFPAAAIDRAARRCADLFGQRMILHALVEGMSDRQEDSSVTFQPGMTNPQSSYESEAGSDFTRRGRNIQKSRSRAPSRALSAADHAMDVPSDEGRSSSFRSRSRSVVSRSVSRSGSQSGGGYYFCPFHGCPRATESFTRRTNMKRHLKLVHGREDEGLPVEVDSEDEMFGAVHVDGFLKPIKVRTGWRNADAAPRKRRNRIKADHESSQDDT
ncbi:RNA polymerase I-specific transcription initiation factor-domain-containing protein [Xylariaceae sp. FL0016]|nr:RNA polymerase I-specific transcription initiation factor-domain-containing protein [Xylariaceae sp. FL0016]